MTGPTTNAAGLDRPWRRPGALRYALTRLVGLLRPPITVTPVRTPMITELDAAVTARDGTGLRVNCYRPDTEASVPVLLAAHPYGKDRLPTRRGRRSTYSFQYRVLRQTGPVRFSTLTG